MESDSAVSYRPIRRLKETSMATLHIEHAISDFETWSGAYSAAAPFREAAGVRAARVSQPEDDPCYVVVQLDFDVADKAKEFRSFLETNIWAVRENSPGLVGAPRTMILEPVIVSVRTAGYVAADRPRVRLPDEVVLSRDEVAIVLAALDVSKGLADHSGDHFSVGRSGS